MGENFLEDFLGEIFLEHFFGRIFWRNFFWRNSLFTSYLNMKGIDLFVKILGFCQAFVLRQNSDKQIWFVC